MFYHREVGQFKTTHAADQAIFPIRQDRIGLALILAVAFVLIPLVSGEFMIASVMVPFLVLSLAAIGLPHPDRLHGLISLGTAAFMGVGAIACYKLSTVFPQVNVVVWICRLRLFRGGLRRAVRPAEPAHQGASTWRSPRLRRNSSCNGASSASRG